MNLFLMITSLLFILFPILLFLFLLISHFENEKLNVTSYTICSSKLPDEFDGCKIALLTDLHDHVFGDNNQPLLQAINNANPDYVMIAGDMVTHQKTFDGAVVYELLKQLTTRHEVYYGSGNHEQKLLLDQETRQAFETFLQSVKALGVHHLANESHIIDKDGASICVNGLELDLECYKKINKRAALSTEFTQTIKKNSPNTFQILLAHNPVFFPEYASWGADLVFSGHVHGGMVVIPGIGGVLSTECRLFPKYDFGKFTKGRATMILSRGLGGHTIKLRIFNRPELVMVALKKTLENDTNN